MPKATSKATPKTGSQIYQLKITLKGIRPPVWRRVQVKSTISLGQLHEIIQFAMGWTNSHMHSFDVGGEEYGQPEPSFDFQVRDEAKAKLNQLVDEKAKFSYTYDFGDSWDHEILVEKVLPADPEADYPLCITGKRACPPEDCGGVWGYANLIEAIADPDHPEHEEMTEWIGDELDPEYFSVEEVNEVLQSL